MNKITNIITVLAVAWGVNAVKASDADRAAAALYDLPEDQRLVIAANILEATDLTTADRVVTDLHNSRYGLRGLAVGVATVEDSPAIRNLQERLGNTSYDEACNSAAVNGAPLPSRPSLAEDLSAIAENIGGHPASSIAVSAHSLRSWINPDQDATTGLYGLFECFGCALDTNLATVFAKMQSDIDPSQPITHGIEALRSKLGFCGDPTAVGGGGDAAASVSGVRPLVGVADAMTDLLGLPPKVTQSRGVFAEGADLHTVEDQLRYVLEILKNQEVDGEKPASGEVTIFAALAKLHRLG
ncbi:MAG: hypothetical protein H6849_03980 [Alphaproteobacteria bacterium]|nr:MAG: hypothetical protein H6849_03980 [Alphaproteobacteria bacterium]